jgi:hypothetical protein
LTPLRDDIAHTTWSANVSLSWIQPDWILQPAPSIKPLREEICMRHEKFIEMTSSKSHTPSRQIISALRLIFETVVDPKPE